MGLFKSIKKAVSGGDSSAKKAAAAAEAERARIAALPIDIPQTPDGAEVDSIQRRMMEMLAKKGRAGASLIGQGGDQTYSRDRLG